MAAQSEDIITVIGSLMIPFGYNLFAKLENQKEKYQSARTVFVVSLYVFAWLVAFIPNKQVWIWLGDGGFYLIGTRYRFIANFIVLSIRFHLVASQILYMLDNYAWLKEANRYFHKLNPTLRISPRMIQFARRSRLICILSSALASILLLLCIYLNNAIQEIFLDNLINYPWFIISCFLAFVPTSIQCYYSGMFVSKMYLLMRMSAEFCDQFNEYFGKILQSKDSPRDIIKCTQQFMDLYLLIQHLNWHLKKAYILLVTCLSMYTLMLFYLAYYKNFPTIFKVLWFAAIIAAIQLITYLSNITGSLNVKTLRMSHQLYSKIVIDKRFEIRSIKPEIQKILNFFACANSSTMGLEVMGKPIDIQATITASFNCTNLTKFLINF